MDEFRYYACSIWISIINNTFWYNSSNKASSSSCFRFLGNHYKEYIILLFCKDFSEKGSPKVTRNSPPRSQFCLTRNENPKSRSPPVWKTPSLHFLLAFSKRYSKNKLHHPTFYNWFGKENKRESSLAATRNTKVRQGRNLTIVKER